MKAFDSIQLLEVTLTKIGNNAMWDAALQVLPAVQIERDCPVIARVTDAKGNQVCITRLNGIPVLVETNRPERFGALALEFQKRWQATPTNKQSVIKHDMRMALQQ